MRYRLCEYYHTSQERETDGKRHCQCICIDFLGIDTFLIGKAETASLQSKDQNNLKDSYISHKFCHDSVARSREQSGVERNEKEIDYSRQDGAEPVNCGLASQLFQRISHNGHKNKYF